MCLCDRHILRPGERNICMYDRHTIPRKISARKICALEYNIYTMQQMSPCDRHLFPNNERSE